MVWKMARCTYRLEHARGTVVHHMGVASKASECTYTGISPDPIWHKGCTGSVNTYSRPCSDSPVPVVLTAGVRLAAMSVLSE